MKPQRTATPIFFLLILFSIYCVYEISNTGNDYTDNLPEKKTEDPYLKHFKTTRFQRKIHFEQNQGQSPESVKFLTRGKGYSLFLESTGILLLLQDNKKNDPEIHQIRMKIEGANEDARIEGCDLQMGKSNYIIGNDPDAWYTDIPNYAKVKYKEIYSGIDLVYYGYEAELEYDFIVRPEGNPKDIILTFDPKDKVRIDKQGDLVLSGEMSQLIMLAPIAYQQKENKRTSVKAHFKLLADNKVCFKVGKYDQDEPLVIDPVIVYSTYLGGEEYDYGTSIAVDDEGCVYVAGKTTSTDFPTENAYQDELHPAMFSNISDVFVSKFSASGNRLIYSTYIGGRWDDEANGIAIDSEGRACITGRTSSNDDEETSEYDGYPLMNAYQTEVDPSFSKAFVTVLNASGNSLEYSTYLGGKMEDWAEDIALDPSGNIYIVGTTFSSSFPTKNAYMPTSPSGYFDAFVAKFDPYLMGESSLVYSTYLGGDLDDWGNAIAVDQQGCAYATGQCKSTDWPVTENAIQSSRVDVYEAFVTKLSASGSELEYSTYLGSEGTDEGRDIAVDSEGHAYVCGASSDGFYTTPGAFKTTVDFGSGFFSKLKTDGTGFEFSTHIPTYTFTLDNDGTAYFIGTRRQAGTSGDTFIGDIYLLVLNSDASDTLYTYMFGGSEGDFGRDIAVDDEGNIYALGSTNSTDFPTLNAYQSIHNGKGETFITKLMPGEPDANLTVYPDPIYFTMIPAGQVSREPIDVVNSSNTSIEISNIDVEPTSMFTLEELPEFPVTLDPGGKLEIQIAFSPGGYKSTESVQSGEYGTLTVVSDAATPITTVPVIVSGIIVNLATDQSDPYPANGICDINPGEDGLQVTLRAAIEHINAMKDDDVTSVTFEIPGVDVPTIKVSKALDEIKYPIHLDASTQQGGRAILSGELAGDYIIGIILGTNNSWINSMEVRSFGGGGIQVGGSGQDSITNCILNGNGIDRGFGIKIVSNRNVIRNNTISNNNIVGLILNTDLAGENLISENRIGTNKDGMFSLGNKGPGIAIMGLSGHNYITENVISGNTGGGIVVVPGSIDETIRYPSYNIISDNMIGVGSDGHTEMGNTTNGILLAGHHIHHHIINGNVISGNSREGILIYGYDNQIQYNWIGVDSTEKVPIPNGTGGVKIIDGYENSISRNTIAANIGHGISIMPDKSRAPLRNLIEENHIGVSKKGYDPAIKLRNSKCGIYLSSSIPAIFENEIASHVIAGIQTVDCADGIINGNEIYYNLTGIDLDHSGSVIVSNVIYENDAGIIIKGNVADEQPAVVALNMIHLNGGENTGIHATDAEVAILGNELSDDLGNAITVEGNSNVLVNYNNILSNQGYGLENLSNQTINAQYNHWGDKTGPGGSGPGLGDKVSDGVDFANWTENWINIVATAKDDTILAPIGRRDSLLIMVGNINYYTDYLAVSVTDDQSWITSSQVFQVETKYDSAYVDYLYIEIPGDIAEGTISKVDLNAASQYNDIDEFNGFFFVKAVRSVVKYFQIDPDTIELEAGNSVQYQAVGYDQFYNIVGTTPDWTCTGGTILDGLYTAGETVGTFMVTANDPASGFQATAQVVIIPKDITKVDKPIEVPVTACIRNIFPNPFKGSVTISYHLDQPSYVLLKVYNMLGREIDILEHNYLPAGEYETIWQANGLPGGMYFVRLQSRETLGSSPRHLETRKLLLME